jgi:peptidoglycan/LPS O-acetylase OafA/YrhL
MERGISGLENPRGGQIDRSPHHFAFVDALRGYAILAVVMIHSAAAVLTMDGMLRNVTSAGIYGVQLFFVVSAFTLFWSLQTRIKVDRKPIAAFFVRRFFRIAPLFWTGLLFYLWHPGKWRAYFAPAGIGWPHIATTFLFVHGWYPSTISSIVPGGWSIGAEAMFYLCIPLLFKRIKSLNGALWIALISTIAVSVGSPQAVQWIAPHFPASWTNLINSFVYYSFPSQAPVFCMGLVLYFVLGRQMVHVPTEPINNKKSSFLLLGIGLFLILGTVPVHVLYAGAFVLLAWGLAIHPTRILVNRATRFIGLVSYSVYIWHFWVLDHLAPRILPLVQVFQSKERNGTVQFFVLYPIVFCVTLLIATLSYYIIELPGQRLGKGLIGQMGWGSAPRIPLPAQALR